VFCLQALQPAAAAAASTLVLHGTRTQPRVALTFDVCQTPGRPTRLDEAVINRLHQQGIPVTLFMGGDWMRTHPRETRALAADPLFELANHSWSHPDLRRRTPAQIAAEVQRTDRELYRLTGRHSRLFRLPFGYYNDATLSTLAALGVEVIQWDVVSADPDPHMTAAHLLRTLKKGVRNGSIVVMHANGRGWHTAEALPGIIALLRARGLQPVTVSQLLAVDQPECRVPLAAGRCVPVPARWPDPGVLLSLGGESGGFAF
jgi:peptidoglycan/xylan/chitin deacetylase (PgdA/CDA1 family)